MVAPHSHLAASEVAIVLPSLVGGGAERVAIDLANHWVETGRRVSIVTIDADREPSFPLADCVQRWGLGLRTHSRSPVAAVWNNLRRVGRLRQRLVELQPSIVVSFTDVTNVTTLISAAGRRLRVIACERTDPRHQHVGRAWSTLRQYWYPRAAAVVVQTDGVARWVREQQWSKEVHVIPNAVPDWPPRMGTAPIASSDSRTVVAIGRLSPEKGFDLLLAAFAATTPHFPDWRLEVWGEGSERAALTQSIERLGMQDRINLAGWTRDSQAVLTNASLFVLSSRYEGFPNALLEAMSVGLPCVAFDCESGPGDIIRHEVDGLLVAPQDATALAKALERLMSDHELRRRLGTSASQVRERFAREAILGRWDALIDRVVRA